MYETDKKQVTASTFPACLSMTLGMHRFSPSIMLYSKAASNIGISIPIIHVSTLLKPLVGGASTTL